MTDIVNNDYDVVAEADVRFEKGSNSSVSLADGVSTETVTVSSESVSDSVLQAEVQGVTAGDVEVINVLDNGDGSVDVVVNNTTGASVTADVVAKGILLG